MPKKRLEQAGLQQLKRDFEARLLLNTLNAFLRVEDLETSVSTALGLLPADELGELIALVQEDKWGDPEWVNSVIATLKSLK